MCFRKDAETFGARLRDPRLAIRQHHSPLSVGCKGLTHLITIASRIPLRGGQDLGFGWFGLSEVIRAGLKRYLMM